MSVSVYLSIIEHVEQKKKKEEKLLTPYTRIFNKHLRKWKIDNNSYSDDRIPNNCQ